MRTRVAVLLFALVGCKRTPPAPPPPVAPVAPVVEPAVVPDAAPPSAPAHAGRPAVATVRVRNVGAAPITILTNPDSNEMVHAWRLNVSDEQRSDRAAIYLNDPALIARVKFFPVDLPPCEGDGGAGFGGLGQTGSRTLAPDEVYELGPWDGYIREEVVDPVRGACLREAPATAGRYRLHFDQPNSTRPDCARLLVRVPLASDGGLPVLEIRCQPRVDAGRGEADEE